MSALREWLTAVAAVSLLLSVCRILVQKGPMKETVSFIGGAVLLTVLLRPLLHIDPVRLEPDTERYRQAVAQRRQELEQAQKAQWKRSIEERTESYISDKAQALGLDLQIRITAQEGPQGIPVPVLAEFWGQRDAALARWLETELGLPAERQVWNED